MVIGRCAWSFALALVVGLPPAAAPANPAKPVPPSSGRSALSTTYRSLISTGPLTRISIGNELSCQIRFLGDSDLELYPPDTTPGDCGTLLAVGRKLYTPNFKARRSATGFGDSEPFTPVSQSARLGRGTTKNPWRIETVVRATTSGLLVREVDSYIARDAGYRTDVTITNQSNGTRAVVLYRAADCYLQESDYGFGFIGKGGSVACTRTPDNKPPDRVEQWVPITRGHHFIEAFFGDVWEAVASRRSFPDTCRCGTRLDNGSGLSWYIKLEPGQSAQRSNLLSFSAQGVVGTLRSNDTTPPQIVIGDVPEGCTREDLQLRISIFDANPIKRIRVYLDGRLVRTPKDPVFGLSIPIDGVGLGGHRVRVTAVDSRGNVGVKSRVFSRCGATPQFVG